MPTDSGAARKCYAATLALALGAAALQSLVADRGIVAIDEGQIASFAERVLRGEVIYRDFYTGIFPGIYYFYAALFRFFGHDLLTTRVAQLGVNTLITVLIHRIALRVSTPYWAFFWAATYSPIVILSFPTLTMLTYSPISMMFALSALLLMLRLTTDSGSGPMIAIGVLLAACGVMKQNYGALAVTATATTLLTAALLAPRNFRGAFRTLTIVATAGAISTAVAFVPLFVSGAGPRFFRYTVSTLLSSQMTAFHQPLPPLFDSAPSQVGNFLFFYLPNALIGHALRAETVLGLPLSESVRWTLIRGGYGGALFLLAAGWLWLVVDFTRLERIEWRARAAVMVFTQLLFFGLFPSAIWSHLVTVLPPVLIVGAMVSESLLRRVHTHPWIARTVSVLACGVLAFSVTVAIQIARDVRRWHPTPTGLARASLHVTPQDAELLRGAVDFLQSCASPGGPVFAAPDLPVLYFLSNHPNPSRYEMLIPGDIDENELIDALETSDTRCLVYNPRMYSHFSPLAESFPEFVRWLDQTFAIEREIGGGDQHWLGLQRGKRKAA